jgi:hypothetical protein
MHALMHLHVIYHACTFTIQHSPWVLKTYNNASGHYQASSRSKLTKPLSNSGSGTAFVRQSLTFSSDLQQATCGSVIIFLSQISRKSRCFDSWPSLRSPHNERAALLSQPITTGPESGKLNDSCARSWLISSKDKSSRATAPQA